ncbi:camphor resistance protein CrcB [Balneicella halophila]|uniref:Fluoride-specific ion channel FluC n=1 Tax=Balneicella halophila TaxID=1537566 RepID=A0A7L4UPG9_BALHA|nr:fluoride efflux transporter CrcB [Balneicella halophila]PVX49953.1 camphor resistance protein CrcB [Balneicella halophila]
MLKNILIVGFGGFIGSILRYMVSWLFMNNSANKTLFPWGTFTVNIIGCLLIGLLWGMMDTYDWFSEELRLFLMVGFCGGFTTFSSYAFEGLIIGKSNLTLSFVYMGISLLTGLLFVYLGHALIKVIS